MLLNIIDLEKVKVEDIMIPHHELVSADANDEDELFEQFKQFNTIVYFSLKDQKTILLEQYI